MICQIEIALEKSENYLHFEWLSDEPFITVTLNEGILETNKTVIGEIEFDLLAQALKTIEASFDKNKEM